MLWGFGFFLCAVCTLQRCPMEGGTEPVELLGSYHTVLSPDFASPSLLWILLTAACAPAHSYGVI